jgi:hypothetical protein
MTGRTAARLIAASILCLGIAGVAHAARFGAGVGHGGHFVSSAGFHGGARVVPFAGARFHPAHFHSRVFIGGAFFAPVYFGAPYYYYPPAYYPPAYYDAPAYYPPATEYVAPQPAPAAASWYYCPSAGGYYPYVRECPGGWQQVAPQPPQ